MTRERKNTRKNKLFQQFILTHLQNQPSSLSPVRPISYNIFPCSRVITLPLSPNQKVKLKAKIQVKARNKYVKVLSIPISRSRPIAEISTQMSPTVNYLHQHGNIYIYIHIYINVNKFSYRNDRIGCFSSPSQTALKSYGKQYDCYQWDASRHFWKLSPVARIKCWLVTFLQTADTFSFVCSDQIFR